MATTPWSSSAATAASQRPRSLRPGHDCSSHAADPGAYDYQNYAGGVDIHWKFLPQTALVFESNFEGRSYFHPEG